MTSTTVGPHVRIDGGGRRRRGGRTAAVASMVAVVAGLSLSLLRRGAALPSQPSRVLEASPRSAAVVAAVEAPAQARFAQDQAPAHASTGHEQVPLSAPSAHPNAPQGPSSTAHAWKPRRTFARQAPKERTEREADASALQSAGAASPSTPRAVDCQPPFYFDSEGLRVFKKECVE
jgi:hypothetical protein